MILFKYSSKRRGVSEVISTLLLLVITMVGAVLVSSMIQNSMLSSTDQTKHADVTTQSIKLTAYDTRDSQKLSSINSLDNKLDQKLCTVSCSTFKDNIPTSVAGNGTDFIVVQVRNLNFSPVYLKNIWINNVEHAFDEQTSGKPFDASGDDLTGNYPLSGKFSIIPGTNIVPLIQQSSGKIENDNEVRLVIKLDEGFSSDIELWRPLQIRFNFGTPSPAEYIILSGDSR